MGPLPRTTLAHLLLVILVAGAGCSTIGWPGPSPPTESVQSPSTGPPTTPTTGFTRPQPVTENIDPVLAGLIDAENRTRYAHTHGLAYRDGRVLVVVELDDNRSVNDRYDIRIEHRVTVSDGVVIQGYLAVDDIRPLVREPFVRSIRPPESPRTVDG